MDALILAGGEMPPDLAAQLPPATRHLARALLPIGGRPMIDYVFDAVRACPAVERIAVAGPPEVAAHVQARAPETVVVPDSGRMMGNAINGLRALRDLPGASSIALITTADVPLVGAATYAEFLRGFEEKNLEGAYAIVRKETCQKAYPEGKRTYANLVEGAVTAGNAVIVEGQIIERLADLFERFYRVRKNPIAMAQLCGANFLWKALTRRLRIVDAENKLAQLAGCRAGAIVMEDAAIAFDVDKIEDLHVAERVLGSRV